MSRILRSLVCLLLICCILFNLSPLKAQASAAGAIGIIKASTVTGNPYVITAALLIALGIYAGVDSGAFETVANNCMNALEAAGTWIKDGAMELLRTEDADGNASYYVDSGLMEDVRSWAIDSSTVTAAMSCTATINSEGYRYFWSDIPFCHVAFTCTETNNYFVGVFTTQPGIIHNSYEFGLEYLKKEITANSSIGCPCNGYYWKVSYGTGSIPSYASDYLYLGDFTYEKLTRYDYGSTSWSGAARFIANEIGLSFKSSAGVSLGSFPLSSTDLTDGTSARQWSEDYTDRGLKVYGGGSGNNNNDGKWFWKLMLPLTAADLLLMSQADEWSGETPKEFDDYTTVEELEIVSRPEVEFGQGLELAPVTSPSPDSGTGTDPDLDPDPDPGTNPGTNPDPGTGTDPTPDSGSSGAPSKDMEFFALDLKEFFPFCIPFDLYDFFTCLNADPVAPVIEWVIPLPGGDTYPLELDLSTFDPVAQLLRRLQLLLFCVGLAFKTRDLIKG